MTTRTANLPPPLETIEQAVVWTTLPQGIVSGNTARVSVFVTPRLVYQAIVGVRQVNSTSLSKFADWSNWPETLTQTGGELSFKVSFNGGAPVAVTTGSLNLAILDPDYWSAIFDPSATRVDSAGVLEDWTSPKISSYNVSSVRSLASDLYSGYTVGQGDPAFAGPLQLSQNQPARPKSASAFAYSHVLAAPATLQDALSFHETVEAASPGTQQVSDFHSAVSSLASYPEMMRYLGLLFPLEITLPAALAGTAGFTVAVIPTWTSSFTGNVNVSPPTMCDATGGTFISVPYGSDYMNGLLNLGLGTEESSNTQFTVVDWDTDGAAESLGNLNQHITATLEPYVETDVSLTVTLPALRSIGPTIVWNDWGAQQSGVSAAGQANPLSSLTYRQSAIQTAIAEFISKGTAIPALYTEDLTKGWRIDVLPSATSGVLTPSWQSLHWRAASYQLGTGGAYQLPVSSATIAEAWVSPSVASPPTAEGEPVSTMVVHEAIVRWDGWSLAAPRPGGQINDDGSLTPGLGNPMPPTSETDAAGNINPQFSAEYSVPAAGIQVTDPVSGQVIGTTGLPLLRYGQSYQYRARAVDLGGWSIPPNSTEASTTTVTTTHCRWEPVRPPLIVPTAALTAGEGSLVMVIRDFGPGGEPPSPPVSNARWLFPPRVHQVMAEEHGFCDTPVGGFEYGANVAPLPNPAVYGALGQYTDGSLSTIPGVVTESAGTSQTPYLILPIPETGAPPPTPVTWLPDPAAFGISIGGLQQGEGEFSVATVIPSNFPVPDGSDNFLDVWAPPIGTNTVVRAWEGWTTAWPVVNGKVLSVVSSTTNPTPSTLRAKPVWTPFPGGDGPYESMTMTVVPGSVYILQISSISSQRMGLGYYSPIGMMGILNWISESTTIPTRYQSLGSAFPYLGIIEQVTPPANLVVVYAVLLPQVAPSFSPSLTLTRAYNDTTVAIADSDYAVDYPSTSLVTFSSTWTDPLDDPTNTANNPAVDTITTQQPNLVATVNAVYPPPVAVSPLIAQQTSQTKNLPFGTLGGAVPFDVSGGLAAVQHIGDTKHHHATYKQVAAGRFGEFFAKTKPFRFSGTTPLTVNGKGVAPNLFSVVLPATSSDRAVIVPPSLYTVNGPHGTVQLKSAAASVTQGSNTVQLSGAALEASWVPPDTRSGPEPDFNVHILSSATPPPLKVVKVAPAWSLTSSGSVDTLYAANRTGNMLRVYLERPWYVTGANELLGVVSAQSSGSGSDAVTPGLPPNVNPLAVSQIGFDPISVPGPQESAVYAQTQLSFLTNTSIPTTATLTGGNPCKVKMADDATASTYELYGYQPQFDPISNLWFADIHLDVAAFPNALPPGYFLQLALVRFQPYSTGLEYNWTSSLTLLTYAQPVTDRAVFVSSGPNNSVHVGVVGPGYFGWRALKTGSAPASPLYDKDNPTATHPNSDGHGAPATSTVVVEVQEYDKASGFSGDFGWSTVDGYTVALAPSLEPGWSDGSATRPPRLGALRCRPPPGP
jgi:hypothetical protein